MFPHTSIRTSSHLPSLEVLNFSHSLLNKCLSKVNLNEKWKLELLQAKSSILRA